MNIVSDVDKNMMQKSGDAFKETRAKSTQDRINREVDEDLAKAKVKDGDAAAIQKFKDANPK